VLLAHYHIELFGPGPVLVTEPAVLVALRMGLLVLLPKEEKSYSLAPEFSVDLRPVRPWSRSWGKYLGWRKEPLFQLSLIQLRRKRPTQPRIFNPAEVVGYRKTANRATSGNLSVTETMFPFQTKNLFDLSHG
jgi:hypothetical protein